MSENVSFAKSKFRQLKEAAMQKADSIRMAIVDTPKRRKTIELEMMANEAASMMQDKKYPLFCKFISGLEKAYRDELIRVSMTAKSTDEQALENARLAAKIQLLEDIKSRPERLKAELKRLEAIA